jgi:hypothetical protein
MTMDWVWTRFHINRTQVVVDPSEPVHTRPELEITVGGNTNPIQRFTGVQFRNNSTFFIDIRDVARALGDYDIEFTRNGRDHWNRHTQSWQRMANDTYVVYSGTNWTNSSTIRSNISAQTSLTERSIRVWQPIQGNWTWRTAYEFNDTGQGGGLMIPVGDIPLFFPGIQSVERNWGVGSSRVQFNITRVQVTPPTPEPPTATGFVQERPNDAHVTGTQLVAAIYRRFVGPNDPNHVMIQWAVDNRLIDGRIQGDDFLTRVIAQPEIYGILAKYSHVFGSNDNWAHRDDSRWAHVSIPTGLEWTCTTSIAYLTRHGRQARIAF